MVYGVTRGFDGAWAASLLSFPLFFCLFFFFFVCVCVSLELEARDVSLILSSTLAPLDTNESS